MFEKSEWLQSFDQVDISSVVRMSLMKDIISFAGGFPHRKAFPVEKISKALTKALLERSYEALQYSSLPGLSGAREAARYRMKIRGVETSIEKIVICAGSQMAMTTLTQMLASKGDTVIVEEPSFMAAIGIIKSYGIRMESIPLDEHGLDTSALRDCLEGLKRKGIRPRYIYSMPNYHNPGGVCMSRERRLEMVEIANKYNIYIIEDDAYSELNYDGIDQTPIKAFDENNRVLYIGTCSKIIAPGIRLGWINGDEEIMKCFAKVRPMLDVCTCTLSQEIFIELTENGILDEHIKSLIPLYSANRNTMRTSLETEMPEGVTWFQSPGGFYFWVHLPEGITCQSVFDIALKKKVGFTPGSFFYVDNRDNGTLRLSYSMLNEESIAEGIKRLSEAVKEVTG